MNFISDSTEKETRIMLRVPLWVPSYCLSVALLQEKIDTARNYYQQLLFRYTKETSSEDQGSRHNATLHKALKTVKDFGEKIRSFEVLNNQTKINV